MIIGHLPAGYLISTVLSKKWRITNERIHQCILLVGMVGAIFPDIDMLYFYFIDHKQHHHHSFFTHFPIVWIVLILISGFFVRSTRYKSFGLLALAFSLNGLVHMMLDSVVGDIQWLAPFNGHYFSLFYVPATYSSVWFNFMLHWSFLFELAVVITAIVVYRKRKYQKISIERRREAFSIAV